VSGHADSGTKPGYRLARAGRGHTGSPHHTSPSQAEAANVRAWLLSELRTRRCCRNDTPVRRHPQRRDAGTERVPCLRQSPPGLLTPKRSADRPPPPTARAASSLSSQHELAPVEEMAREGDGDDLLFATETGHRLHASAVKRTVVWSELAEVPLIEATAARRRTVGRGRPRSARVPRVSLSRQQTEQLAQLGLTAMRCSCVCLRQHR
jgi:hypothetical protein